MDIKILSSGSKGNAYILSDGVTTLLLDAGISIREIKKGTGFTLNSIEACLVTHSHGDHSKAAHDLAKAGVNVYTSQGTIEACNLSGHRVKQIGVLQDFIVGTFKILPFDVEHDAPEPLGFLIESLHTHAKLLYVTDTCYIKYKFAGITHALIEVNYDNESLNSAVGNGTTNISLAKRIILSHMSLETALDVLRTQKKLQKVYALHLSDSHANEQRIKSEIQKLTGVEVVIC